MPSTWSPGEAVRFVERHGVVLESARGPVPALASAIAGTDIRGSWWGHSSGHAIFRATRAVRDSEDVLVCRIVDGKITYVHRRLWPALVRAANMFPSDRLAAIREEHTATGAHKVIVTPFPEWVPHGVRQAATEIPVSLARQELGAWLMVQTPGPATRPEAPESDRRGKLARPGRQSKRARRC
jgi:hypothetical protein